MTTPTPLLLRHKGLCEYTPTFQAMQTFSQSRNSDTLDELWLLQHPPVFTLGLNARPEHLLTPGDIPVVQTDRGGQVTYHGPGQLVAYLLLDLRRRRLGVRQVVSAMEQSVIALLAEHGVSAEARAEAPGVYVRGRKIAALGLRVKNGRSYHGLSLNLDMDLEPFRRINPCGYTGLEVTQWRDLLGPADLAHIETRLAGHLARQLGYRLEHGD